MKNAPVYVDVSKSLKLFETTLTLRCPCKFRFVQEFMKWNSNACKAFHKPSPKCTNTQEPAKFFFILRGLPVSDYIQLLSLWPNTNLTDLVANWLSFPDNLNPNFLIDCNNLSTLCSSKLELKKIIIQVGQ